MRPQFSQVKLFQSGLLPKAVAVGLQAPHTARPRGDLRPDCPATNTGSRGLKVCPQTVQFSALSPWTMGAIDRAITRNGTPYGRAKDRACYALG